MRNQRLGLNTLSFESSIQFGKNGNYLAFDPEGFSNENAVGYTWNDGFTASLQFQTPAPIDAGVLSVTSNPFITDGLASQDLSVYLNGLWIGFGRMSQPTTISCTIGPRYIVPGQNILAFVMPNATTPHSIGAGGDMRRLALAFQEIVLAPKE